MLGTLFINQQGQASLGKGKPFLVSVRPFPRITSSGLESYLKKYRYNNNFVKEVILQGFVFSWFKFCIFTNFQNSYCLKYYFVLGMRQENQSKDNPVILRLEFNTRNTEGGQRQQELRQRTFSTGDSPSGHLCPAVKWFVFNFHKGNHTDAIMHLRPWCLCPKEI